MGTELVVVQNIDQALIDSYGVRMHRPLEKALAGERKGKWFIVRGVSEVVDARAGAIPRPGPSAFTGDGKLRVAWVQDNDRRFVGGAEISGDLVARIGIDLGFDVVHATSSTFSEPVLAEADLLVLNNLLGFSARQMTAILHAMFERRMPFIKYEHDHRELDRVEFSRRIFSRSALNVFLSPAHRDNHVRALGCDGVCLPLAIDVDTYRPVEGVARDPNTALISNCRNFKRWTTLQAYIDAHPEMRFTVLGPEGVVRGANVNVAPKVPPADMPAVYSRHGKIVHLLDGWGAGERVVLEAALCGAEVVANERVGHASWGRELADKNGFRSWLAAAPYEFWRLAEGCLR